PLFGSAVRTPAVEISLGGTQRCAGASQNERVFHLCPTSTRILPLRLARQAVFHTAFLLRSQRVELLQKSLRILPRDRFDGEQIEVGVAHVLDTVLASPRFAEVAGGVASDGLPLPLSHRTDAQPERPRSLLLVALLVFVSVLLLGR